MALLTFLSMGVLIYMVLVPFAEVDTVLFETDALICIVFLFDVARSVSRASDRRAYVFGVRVGRSIPYGLIEFLGSLPGLAILRPLRLVRLRETSRVVGIHRPRYLIAEFLAQRAQSAAYVVVLAALLTLTIGASLMAVVEEPAPNANITTGGDAFWWAFVTMTTVGYGDTYPVTEAGRFIGMVTMAVGVAIIGVLSSFLASWFLSPRRIGGRRRADDLRDPAVRAVRRRASATAPTAAADPLDTLTEEIRAMRADLAELQRQDRRRRWHPASMTAPPATVDGRAPPAGRRPATSSSRAGCGGWPPSAGACWPRWPSAWCSSAWPSPCRRSRPSIVVALIVASTFAPAVRRLRSTAAGAG